MHQFAVEEEENEEAQEEATKDEAAIQVVSSAKREHRLTSWQLLIEG